MPDEEEPACFAVRSRNRDHALLTQTASVLVNSDQSKVLSCFDVDFDSFWGDVLAFHSFRLESPEIPWFCSDENHPSIEPDQLTPGIPDAQNNDVFAARRNEATYETYIPSLFDFHRLKTINKFHPHEMIVSTEDIFDLCSDFASRTVQTSKFLCCTPSTVSYESIPRLMSVIAAMHNLQVLIVRDLGLQFLDDFSWPKLLYLDLSGNRINDAKAVLRVISLCKALHTADFTGNPFLLHDAALEDRIVAQCPSLQSVNRRTVDIGTKIRATTMWGSEQSKRDLEMEVWDFQMCRNVSVQRLSAWEPTSLTHLDVGQCGLAVFHLGELTNLLSLDLSGNRLRSLQGGGLEQLGRLRRLLLAGNRLGAAADILPLQALQALTALSLRPQQAPDELTAAQSYRVMVITLTIDSVGSNAQPALNFLDLRSRAEAPPPDQQAEREWMEVTVEEWLAGLQGAGRVDASGAEEARCRWAVQRVVGQRRLQDPAALRRLTVLSLSHQNLATVHLPPAPALLSLDLSHNRIAALLGLPALSRLRSLSLAANPPLQSEPGARLLLTALQPLTSLHAISLPFSAHLHPPGGVAARSSQQHLLRLLIRRHPLLLLNLRPVALADRVRVYQELGASPGEAAWYLCSLAIATSVSRRRNCTCAHPPPPRHHAEHPPPCPVSAAAQLRPEDLREGLRCAAAQVLELPDLGGLGLSSGALRRCLPPLTALRRLNLSRNALDSLLGLGLERMPLLAALDASHNRIADPLPALAALLDAAPALAVACLRGNPAMRSPAQRRALLCLVRRVWDGGSLLRCLDSEVTLEERVAARHAAEGGGGAAGEEGAAVEAALGVCCGGEAARSVAELELSHLGLGGGVVQRGALERFVGLRRLFLAGNSLAGLGALSSSDCAPRLQVLDVRENVLESRQEVAQAVLAHSELVELGVEGNLCVCAAAVCADGYTEARALLVGLLVEKRLGLPGCELRFIDDREVTVEEITEGWGSCTRDKERFRFQECVVREMQRQVDEGRLRGGAAAWEVEELRLGARGLSCLQCAGLSSLTRLDVSGNALTSSALSAAGLLSLRGLAELDVSANAIDDGGVVARVVRAGHAAGGLRSVSVAGNPFFPAGSDARAREAFLAQLPFLSRPGATLTALNSLPITISERVAALAANRPSPLSLQHDCRLALLLESLGASTHSSSLSLPGRQLASLSRLGSFLHLSSLVVCDNLLEDLAPLPSLPCLASLDIRYNRLPSTPGVFRALASADALRHLWLEGAARDWARWHLVHPFFWNEAFRSLPALLGCDDALNPAPLADFQWAALLQLKAALGLGPNAVAEVDVEGRGLGAADFFRLRDWLAFLPVRSLSVQGNPFCIEFPQYRFVLINDVQSLLRLDGSRISEPERANALKKVQELRASTAYYPPNVDSLKLETTTRPLRMPPPSSQRTSSSTEYSSWGSKLETSLSFFQVHAFISSLPGVPWDSLPVYQHLRWVLQPFILSVDSLVPQLQCLCFWGYLKAAFCVVVPLLLGGLLVTGSDWSRWEYDIQHRLGRTVALQLLKSLLWCGVGVGVSLGLDCVDCGAMAAVREKMRAGEALSEGEELCRAVSGVGECSAWRGLLGGLRGEWEWVGGRGLAVGWCGVVAGWTVGWVVVAGMVRWKNRRARDQGFWFGLRRTRKKAALLLLALLYLPIATLLIDNVRPFPQTLPVAGDGPQGIKWGFASGGCLVRQGRASAACAPYPTSLERLADPGYAMFWVSAGFALLYMVAVPVLLARYIRGAVEAIDRNNPCHVLIFAEAAALQDPWARRARRRWERGLAAAAGCVGGVRGWMGGGGRSEVPVGGSGEEEEAAREERQAEQAAARRRRLLAEGNRKYQQAVGEFDDARAALYCSYRWHCRSFKLVALAEKVLLLAASVALSPAALSAALGPPRFAGLEGQELHRAVPVLIVGAFFVLAAWLRPFADWQDGCIDFACRLTNVCNALVLFLAAKPLVLGHPTFDRADDRPCPGQTSWIAAGGGSAQSQAETREPGDAFCGFLTRAGYAVGVMNFACLGVVLLSLLASPVRWFLRKRRAESDAEGQLPYKPVEPPAECRNSDGHARDGDEEGVFCSWVARARKALARGGGSKKCEETAPGEGARDSLLCPEEPLGEEKGECVEELDQEQQTPACESRGGA